MKPIIIPIFGWYFTKSVLVLNSRCSKTSFLHPSESILGSPLYGIYIWNQTNVSIFTLDFLIVQELKKCR